MISSEKVPVVIDDKCIMCSLQVVTVRGGKQVLYVADDSSIVKRESLHRYKERMKRRKQVSDSR